MNKHLLIALPLISLSSPVWALNYDQTITAIFGSGNPNTGWTTGEGGGLTLALRGKNRDDGSTPNTDGVYTFAAGYSLSAPALALWNFEFSIDIGAQAFNTYNFYLGVDLDPTLGVNYVSSLINPLSLEDNYYGNSGTLNGQGVESTFAGALGSNPRVVQNSLNMGFIPGFDPLLEGTFDFRLFAVLAHEEGNSPDPDSGNNPIAQNSSPVADVNIRVVVSSATAVPDAGGTLALISLSMVGLAGLGFRKRQV